LSNWKGDGDITGEIEERMVGKEHHISPPSADTPSRQTAPLLSNLGFLLCGLKHGGLEGVAQRK
jgi:hypothetical protein